MKKKSKAKFDIYGDITAKIIKALDAGVVPWHRPWLGADTTPRSLATGKPYGGVNTVLLALAGYSSPYWATFKAIKALGGNIKAGSQSEMAVFFKWIVLEDVDPVTGVKEKKKVPMLRGFRVFNLEQAENIPADKVPADAYPTLEPVDWDPVQKAEALLSEAFEADRVPPVQHDGGGRAFYSPGTDSVHLPARDRFETAGGYYGVAFHELGHATGHSSRLDRGLDTKPTGFGSKSYSREELVAELTATFLCGETGLDSSEILNNSASYIDSWRRKLSKDKKLIVTASAQAQKSANWIKGTHFSQTSK